MPCLRILDDLGEEGATYSLPRSRSCDDDRYEGSLIPPVSAEAAQQADEQLVVVRQLAAHRARLVTGCIVLCL